MPTRARLGDEPDERERPDADRGVDGEVAPEGGVIPADAAPLEQGRREQRAAHK